MHLYHWQKTAESGVAQTPLTVENGLQNYVMCFICKQGKKCLSFIVRL